MRSILDWISMWINNLNHKTVANVYLNVSSVLQNEFLKHKYRSQLTGGHLQENIKRPNLMLV